MTQLNARPPIPVPDVPLRDVLIPSGTLVYLYGSSALKSRIGQCLDAGKVQRTYGLADGEGQIRIAAGEVFFAMTSQRDALATTDGRQFRITWTNGIGSLTPA